MIEITRLPNGLRIVTDTVESVETVSMGIWASVGSRHENDKNNGVAHFVEHMLFKGTPTRTATDIAKQIENVGGHINAYTGREITGYYMHLLKNDALLGIDILSDLIQNPLFSEEELEKERHVVLQEIGMYEDTPDEIIFDHFQETAYANHPLGAPILGTNEIIKEMDRDCLFDYCSKSYTPSSLVISVSGNIDHQTVVDEFSSRMTNLNKDQDISYVPAKYSGGSKVTQKDLEQVHVLLGFKGVSRNDENYYSAIALSTILGGGMSSRLYQKIRQDRGLVYSIYSFHSSFQDSGLFGIYAGTGEKDIAELIPVTCDEVLNISQEIEQEEFDRAKAQLRASILMGRESMISRADQQAKHLIFFDKVMETDEKIAKIDALSIDGVKDMAQKIFSSKVTLSAIGPVSQLEDYDQITKRLTA